MLGRVSLCLALALLPLTASAQLQGFPPGAFDNIAARSPQPVGCNISDVTLSGNTFTGGTTSGTVVGAISVPASGCTFGGTVALGGTDAASFQLSSTSLPSNLETNGTVAAGSYSISLTATDGAAANSPFVKTPIAITGTSSFSTWNPSDKDASITLSNGNLTATTTTTGAWRSVRSTTSHASPDKVYFEYTLVASDTDGDLGLAIVNGSAPTNTYFAASTNGYNFFLPTAGGAGGNVWYNAGLVDSNMFARPTVGQVQGIAVDFGAKLVWLKNISAGTGWNVGAVGTQDPATGAGGLSISGVSGSLFIGFSGLQLNTADSVTLNVGASAFSGTAPAGFSAWH